MTVCKASILHLCLISAVGPQFGGAQPDAFFSRPMSHSLAEMEATVHPVQLALKEEEEEEAIESPADMQKVRICSEGGWVSE